MTNQAVAANHSDQLDNDHADTLVALCKASADQLRLDILRVLSRDSFGVLELCNILNYKQSGLSHHLKILAKAGLLSTRREGNTIFYRRAHHAIDRRFDELQQSIFSAADQLSLSTVTQQRLHDIQQARTERSREFFSLNADKFKQQQEHVAAYELYGLNTADLVIRNAKSKHSILELGPGEGVFLAELAPAFCEVYALDNAEQMLNKAKLFTAQQHINNVHFIHGDTKHPALSHLSIDNIVMNMVLHHIPSPAELFLDLATILNPEGRLFVTDLCPHDQQWTQDACGDLWLGFDPEDLSDWANSAGFIDGQSFYLTQLNGFRVQIREFILTTSNA